MVLGFFFHRSSRLGILLGFMGIYEMSLVSNQGYVGLV